MRSDKITWLSTSALLCAAAIAAGCSGGGGGSSPTPVTKPAPPTTTTSAKKYDVSIKFTTETSSKSKTTARRAAASTLGSKKPEYISPATLGAIVTATSTDGVPANNTTSGYDLSPSNSACEYVSSEQQSDALVCTIMIPLAADTYSIQLVTYDQNEVGLSGAGNALSIDVEPETVSAGSANSFTFNPHAYVVGFDYEDNDEDSATARSPGLNARVRALQSSLTARGRKASMKRNAARRVPLDLASSTTAAPHLGTDAGEFNFFDVYAGTLDRDLYFVDQYPGDATFANGVFYPVPTESGDTTGCTGEDVCSAVLSNNGTTFPANGPTPGPSNPPVTITNAETNQEDLTFAYTGGGGVGSGIENWLVHTFPSGTPPYSVDFSIPAATPGAFGTVTPYVVPNLFVSPLFAYSTDGAGNPSNTTPQTGGPIYVWGGQAIVPDGADASGGSYSASFAGSSTCQDVNSNTIMTVGQMDFAAGFGEVVEVDVTPSSSQVSCTLTIEDGVGDAVTATLNNTAEPVVIEGGPRNPQRSISNKHGNLLGGR